MKTAASIIVGAALASKSALAFPFLRDPKSIELKTEDDRQLSQYQRNLVVSFLKVYMTRTAADLSHSLSKWASNSL